MDYEFSEKMTVEAGTKRDLVAWVFAAVENGVQPVKTGVEVV